jgi:hypothetical protein
VFHDFRPSSLPTATTGDHGLLSLIAAIRQQVPGVNGYVDLIYPGKSMKFETGRDLALAFDCFGLIDRSQSPRLGRVPFKRHFGALMTQARWRSRPVGSPLASIRSSRSSGVRVPLSDLALGFIKPFQFRRRFSGR